LTYATSLVIAQFGWVALLVADTSVGTMFAAVGILILIELAGPVIAERRFGGTPWHPHHIAERYALLTIITLGEVILGTVAAVDAVIRVDGWTVETALVGFAGVGLTFGMWWMYFVIPYGELLHQYRHRSFGWGYGHLFLFASLAATGVGLHVAALFIEDEAHLSTLAAVATTAVPLAVYVLSLYGLYSLLTRQIDPFHVWLIAGTAVVITTAIVMAAADAPIAACLLVLTLAPVVTVAGYELLGHRHIADVVARAHAEQPAH
jgi:low temperature requirement protein LtrA